MVLSCPVFPFATKENITFRCQHILQQSLDEPRRLETSKSITIIHRLPVLLLTSLIQDHKGIRLVLRCVPPDSEITKQSESRVPQRRPFDCQTKRLRSNNFFNPSNPFTITSHRIRTPFQKNGRHYRNHLRFVGTPLLNTFCSAPRRANRHAPIGGQNGSLFHVQTPQHVNDSNATRFGRCGGGHRDRSRPRCTRRRTAFSVSERYRIVPSPMVTARRSFGSALRLERRPVRRPCARSYTTALHAEPPMWNGVASHWRGPGWSSTSAGENGSCGTPNASLASVHANASCDCTHAVASQNEAPPRPATRGSRRRRRKNGGAHRHPPTPIETPSDASHSLPPSGTVARTSRMPSGSGDRAPTHRFASSMCTVGSCRS